MFKPIFMHKFGFASGLFFLLMVMFGQVSLPKNEIENSGPRSFNSIQDYLYSAFYDTIVAKQLHRKFSF